MRRGHRGRHDRMRRHLRVPERAPALRVTVGEPTGFWCFGANTRSARWNMPVCPLTAAGCISESGGLLHARGHRSAVRPRGDGGPVHRRVRELGNPWRPPCVDWPAVDAPAAAQGSLAGRIAATASSSKPPGPWWLETWTPIWTSMNRFPGTATTALVSGGPVSALFKGASADGTRVLYETAGAHRASDTDAPRVDIYKAEVASTAGHPRPAGATPLRIALVPAAQECTTPNRHTAHRWRSAPARRPHPAHRTCGRCG